MLNKNLSILIISLFVLCAVIGVNSLSDNLGDLPTSCAEALKFFKNSGIYQLYLPKSGLKPFYAYCLRDPDNGPGWTVVQRRQDGSMDFYLNWVDYKFGFGNLEGEHFLGLDKLYALTNNQVQELWFHLEDFENATRNAYYSSFAINDENSKYALNVLGKYSGNAGDSFTAHAGAKFSTKDNDNDNWDKSCAQTYTGAWWYKACHKSNLNGQYLRGPYPKDKFAQGVNWFDWHDYYYSLKYTHIAIRPISR
ncbi:fibrinogen C domain-containing protein 1-like [Teleopsis dalmanni]|uniref:fibrinogen C domain-containing protein 1-like n=1 Tax=Teleopsis dalmanni TaxID=139649 RepID=UPI0018CEADD1|nr:fibrinogen C domain-containing protein 1-like [Teleopsis dalmanni]